MAIENSAPSQIRGDRALSGGSFDLRPVFFLIGMLSGGLGVSMLFPMGIDLLEGNGHWTSFAISAVLTCLVGSSLAISTANGVGEGLTVPQTFMVTSGVFLVLPMFGALPFVLGAPNARIVDAFFESMSGLTTTGATILTNLEEQPSGILLWRGMLQWFGGIGMIVVALVFLPQLRVGGMQLFRWGSQDTLSTILPRAAHITRLISWTYVLLTIGCVVGYSFAGMTTFDAVVHSMTTVATGGFANSDTSFQNFGARAEYVASAFMILAALPFVRYVQLLQGSTTPIFRDSQIRAFLLITLSVIAALGIWQLGVNAEEPEVAFRKSLFNGISILTGTGYASSDYNSWGGFPVVVFFLIGLIGGCAGSTSCSVKIFRYQLLVASIKASVNKVLFPHAVFTPRYEKRSVPQEVLSSVMTFFFIFLATLIVSAILLSISGLDPLTSISGAAAALANIGPGLGEAIGPSGNYGGLNDFAKWLLAALMLIGRLELLTIYAMLTMRFWRR